MEKIQREDMLSLTRRMTVKRASVTRIAGCYTDKDGEIDGTFNVCFLNLSLEEREKNLKLAKAVPFAKTNEALKRYALENMEIRQLLMRIRECGLKNDALLDILYGKINEVYQSKKEYGFYLFHDVYDIFSKTSDKERLEDSEESFSYLIGVICPVFGDYEPGEPVWGFIYPAFTGQGGILNGIDIYQKKEADSLRGLSDFFLK